MKLSTRLAAMASLYRGQEEVWDIGCDHGLLGLSFAHIPDIKHIYLVDPSQSVIDTLKPVVAAYITEAPSISILHQTGQQTKISAQSNCIFIAGMGGKEIVEIARQLLPQLRSSDLLVISPQNHVLLTRSRLREMALGLAQEKVVLDRNRYYQILALRRDPSLRPPSLYGDFWDHEHGDGYRAHLLKHLACHQDVATREFIRWLKEKSDLI